MIEKNRYFIDYHTGAGNEYADTLEEAKRIADKGACYTQTSISIIDTTTGECVAGRRWYGVAYNSHYDGDYVVCKDPIIFGSWGYYDDWDDEIFI